MDTRKLIVTETARDLGEGSYTSLRLAADQAEAARSTGYEVAEILDSDVAAELVKRWNAYPELVSLLNDAYQDEAHVCEDGEVEEEHCRACQMEKVLADYHEDAEA